MSHLLDSSAKGVYTISATPFTDSGDIDWPKSNRSPPSSETKHALRCVARACALSTFAWLL